MASIFSLCRTGWCRCRLCEYKRCAESTRVEGTRLAASSENYENYENHERGGFHWADKEQQDHINRRINSPKQMNTVTENGAESDYPDFPPIRFRAVFFVLETTATEAFMWKTTGGRKHKELCKNRKIH